MARVRPHFKTHCSLKYHRKSAQFYADNDLLAMHTRLGVLAIERWAAKDGGKFRIARSEVGALAGGKRRDKAEALLLRLASYLELSCNLVGSYFELEWTKLEEKQGFGPKNVQRMYKEPPAPDTIGAAPPFKGRPPLEEPPQKRIPEPPPSTPQLDAFEAERARRARRPGVSH